MTVAWAISFLLGAGMLAVAILLGCAAIKLGRVLGRVDRLAAMLRWPEPVHGGPSC